MSAEPLLSVLLVSPLRVVEWGWIVGGPGCGGDSVGAREGGFWQQRPHQDPTPFSQPDPPESLWMCTSQIVDMDPRSPPPPKVIWLTVGQVKKIDILPDWPLTPSWHAARALSAALRVMGQQRIGLDCIC